MSERAARLLLVRPVGATNKRAKAGSNFRIRQ